MMLRRGLGATPAALDFPFITGVCDPFYTQNYGGACADSQGYLVKADGMRPLEVDHAANDPNYSMTVSASSGSGTIFGIDPKTAALIGGAILAFVVLSKK